MKKISRNKTPDQDAQTVLSPAGSTKKAKRSNKPRRPQTTTGNGTVVQSWAGAAGKWMFYVLAVIVALGSLCGFLAFNRPAPQVQLATETETDSQEQEAGAFAQSYLAAWLTATTTDQDELGQYTGEAVPSLAGTSPTEYRDLTVASIQPADENLTTVIVSASLKTTSTDNAGEETVSWTPYWYQVAVHTQGEKMAAAGLPAPISMPAVGTPPQLGYPSRVANTEVQATVADFMTAYLTGQGDVTRYVSPEATIDAITPSYWTEASVRTLQSTKEVADTAPAAGQSAEILVNIDLTRDSITKPAQYVLGLKVRDGRWEVSSLNSAPSLSN